MVKERVEEAVNGVRGEILGRPNLIFIFIFYLSFILYFITSLYVSYSMLHVRDFF